MFCLPVRLEFFCKLVAVCLCIYFARISINFNGILARSPMGETAFFDESVSLADVAISRHVRVVTVQSQTRIEADLPLDGNLVPTIPLAIFDEFFAKRHVLGKNRRY